MDSTGWEMKPAGWIAIAILIGLILYYVIQRQQNPLEGTSK